VKVLASGRDADVYAYDEKLVLRRYRDGRSAEREAATMRKVARLEYPVPKVHRASGPDIVMERIEGPTLAEAMFDGFSPGGVGRILAQLHDRLHALDWPEARPGECLLHMDLHPLNVMMSGSSPVVIDWSNSRPGPAALDVALTAIILAQVVRAGVPASAGLSAPRSSQGATLRTAADRVLQAFSQCAGPYRHQLSTAGELRSQDPFQSPEELSALDSAAEYAFSLSGAARP
jgi:aminoglycoside phosphotransferase (APT) family kinase protein